MRFFRAFSLLGAVILASSLAAYGQQIETTPIPLTPKPDFSSMAFMTGTWNCSVLSARRPGPYQTTAVTTMSPDGYWLITRTTVHKASWIPQEFTSEDRITYDPSTSRWIDMEYDPLGGYDLSTSPGWNGNTIVWTDVAYPKTGATAQNNPTTMTKVSSTRTTSVSSFAEPSGRTVRVTTTCTKSS